MILMIEFLYAIITFVVIFVVMYGIHWIIEEVKWFFLMRKERKKLVKTKEILENYGSENK